MMLGRDGCLDVVRRMVCALDGNLLWDKVSRADVCVDLPGVDTAVFVQAFLDGHCITRARKRTVHYDGNRPTGLDLGAGNEISCCIYDKLLECTDERKLAVLKAKRWGGNVQAATRVEFRLRREALKSFGVNSLADYREKRSGILSYLCTQWLRMASEDVDRTHTTRTELDSLWQEVLRCFLAWSASPVVPVTRAKRVAVNGLGLIRQAVGCLTSAIVRRSNGEILEQDDLLERMMEIIWREIPVLDVERIQTDKALRWLAAGPVTYTGPCVALA